MLWNLNAFIQTCFITICSMAFIHAFLYANKAIPKDIRKLFILLTQVLVLESVEEYLDGRLYLYPYKDVAFWHLLVSTVGYCVRPMMLHVVLLIMSRNLKWRPKYVLLAIPSVITFLTCIPAFFTDWVFGYADDHTFQAGPLRYVFFAMLAVYFIIILVSAIVNFKKRGSETFVIIGIILLLSADWILVLFFDNTSVHMEIEVLCTILYFMYFVSVFNAKRMKEKEIERIESEQRLTKTMLDQAIETLAYTIDAKDEYTKGHSSRVAKYARMIASVSGKSEEECREIYLAGLLHDIGKISIDDTIISKPGKLDDEEYEKIKKHPAYGAKILEKMKSIPFLQNGALYHHERYDGKGYPTGIAGEEIPELARIISVADAYDAMTSYRSYRPTMDQSIVKQEIWKGIGTQFDPQFAKIMIALIDADVNYEMREKVGEQDEIKFDDVNIRIEWPTAPKEQVAEIHMMQETDARTLAAFILIDGHWFRPGEGICLSNENKQISFHSVTREGASFVWSAPAVIVYSSDDGQVLGPNYDELGVVMSAGYGWYAGSAQGEQSSFTKNEDFESWDNWIARNKAGLDFTLNAVLVKNEVVLTINNDLIKMNSRITLPGKYSRKVYVAISGERCDISDIKT